MNRLRVKSQQGFAHWLILLLVVVVIGGVTDLYFAQYHKSATNGATLANSSTAVAKPTTPSATIAYIKAYSAADFSQLQTQLRQTMQGGYVKFVDQNDIPSATYQLPGHNIKITSDILARGSAYTTVDTGSDDPAYAIVDPDTATGKALDTASAKVITQLEQAFSAAGYTRKASYRGYDPITAKTADFQVVYRNNTVQCIIDVYSATDVACYTLAAMTADAQADALPVAQALAAAGVIKLSDSRYLYLESIEQGKEGYTNLGVIVADIGAYKLDGKEYDFYKAPGGSWKYAAGVSANYSCDALRTPELNKAFYCVQSDGGQVVSRTSTF